MPNSSSVSKPSHRSDILIDNKHIYHFENIALKFIKWITWIVTFLFIIGFFQTKPQPFEDFHFVVSVIIGLFLIYRFNHYRKYKIHFTELDQKICYSAGIYIIVSSFINIINTYTEKVRGVISPYTNPVVGSIKDLIKGSVKNIW